MQVVLACETWGRLLVRRQLLGLVLRYDELHLSSAETEVDAAVIGTHERLDRAQRKISANRSVANLVYVAQETVVNPLGDAHLAARVSRIADVQRSDRPPPDQVFLKVAHSLWNQLSQIRLEDLKTWTRSESKPLVGS
jgi:hypothetical protein